MPESMSVEGLSGLMEQGQEQQAPIQESASPAQDQQVENSKKPLDEKLSSKFAALSRKEKMDGVASAVGGAGAQPLLAAFVEHAENIDPAALDQLEALVRSARARSEQQEH